MLAKGTKQTVLKDERPAQPASNPESNLGTADVLMALH